MPAENKVHINFNMEDEKDRQAFEILQEVRKTGTLKGYVVEAVIEYHSQGRTLRQLKEEMEEAFLKYDMQIRKLCDAIGLNMP